MRFNGLWLGLTVVAALTGLSACNRMSDDRFGVYADGDFFIATNYDTHRINFTNESHPTAEDLLAGAAHGDGVGFATWRDAGSCGLRDDKDNIFLLPRTRNTAKRGVLTFTVVADDPVYAKANGGDTHTTTVQVTGEGRVRMAYTYDDTIGIRSIDRYANGQFDRRIVLQKGVGLLEHCRGFSLQDFRWYNDLNTEKK